MISDNIGVNFIMELGESILNDDTAVMTFEINGKKTEVAVKDSTETVITERQYIASLAIRLPQK